MFDFLKKKKEVVKIATFADQLSSIKQVFKDAYDGASALNDAILLDNKNKEVEINTIQSKIDFNNKVLKESSSFIDKLGEILK